MWCPSATNPGNQALSSSAADVGDDVLVRQSTLGSREAFGLLVVRYSRSVRAVCIARSGRCSDLDDLVQEAFLRAYRGLGRLEEPARFGAYLHRIAHNLCVDRLRRSGKEPVAVEDVDLVLPEPQPTTPDVREERLDRLRQHVGRLPLALREAVLLFYFEQKSLAAIGAMLGISEAAVNQRLHRARVQLRQVLGGTPAGADGGDA